MSSGAGTRDDGHFCTNHHLCIACCCGVCTLHFVRWPFDVSCRLVAFSGSGSGLSALPVAPYEYSSYRVSRLASSSSEPALQASLSIAPFPWLHPEQALQLLPRRWAKWRRIQCRLDSRIYPELPLSLNVRALGLIGGTLGRGLLIAVGRRGRGYLYLPQLNG
jgi:hypothetical protein